MNDNTVAFLAVIAGAVCLGLGIWAGFDNKLQGMIAGVIAAYLETMIAIYLLIRD